MNKYWILFQNFVIFSITAMLMKLNKKNELKYRKWAARKSIPT